MPNAIDASREITEQEAVTAMAEYEEYKQAVAQIEKRQKADQDTVRAYLDKTGQRQLIDGERGIGAWLIDTERDAQFDLEGLSDDSIVLLARAGYLRAVAKTAMAVAAKGHPRAAEIADRALMPGKPGTRLRIGKSKD